MDNVLKDHSHPRYFVDFIRLGSFDVAALIWVISVCITEQAVDIGKAKLQISELSIRSHEADKVVLAVKRGQGISD